MRLVVASVILGFTATFAPARAWAQGEPPAFVAVAKAERRDVPSTVRLVGTVRPFRRSTLGSEVPGLVKELHVEEGDRVEKGEVICRLDDVVARLLLDAARSTLAESEARLAELEAGTRAEELRRLKAKTDEAQAMLTKWQHERARVAELERTSSATPKEINDTAAELSAAQQRFEQAKAEYDEAVAGPRKETIEQARASVAAQRHVVARLEDQVDKTQIRAPFSGYVTVKHTEVGEWVATGGPIVELVELDHVLVRIDVPEADISSAERGKSVRIHIDALKETFAGTIARVVPQADLAARTFPVDVDLPNPQARIKAGMFTRATMPGGETVQAVVVPVDAVIQRGGVDMVVAVVKGQAGLMAVPMPVLVGAEVDGVVAVRGDQIAAGMDVVIRGQERIYVPKPAIIVPISEIAPAPTPTTAPAGAPTTQPVAAAR